MDINKLTQAIFAHLESAGYGEHLVRDDSAQRYSGAAESIEFVLIKKWQHSLRQL
jgi:hypothetical protein